MAKNTTKAVDEVQDNFENLGGSAKGVTGLKEVDPFESLPAFVVDKNWSKGRKICGRFVSSKVVYSDKFTAGRIDKVTGKMCRTRHILEDVNAKQQFVLWGCGSLDVIMSRLSPNQYVELTYTGRAEKPLKAGQTPPYQFKVASDMPLRDLDQQVAESAAVEG